ncbi:MAG: hypothetical protein M3112_00190 [Actinomycetia bacterium]|nr:hypothetical protein [Actinomycetes bacterium]
MGAIDVTTSDGETNNSGQHHTKVTTFLNPAFSGEMAYDGLELVDNATPIIPGGVVEFRVHGVNGGTPEQNLGDPHPIRVAGDATAGVYRRREELNSGPDRTVEAYNWSSMNSRKSIRAWWLLLFPFAASGFAGWLLPPTLTTDERTVARAVVRILALIVTFVAVVGMGLTTIDIIGVQCGGSSACTSNFWLGWLDRIAGWGPLEGLATRRAVIFTIFPLAALFGAWWAGRRSNSYEIYGAPIVPGTGPAGAARIDDVHMDQVEFWQAPDTVYVQMWIHTSVALSGLAMVMALVFRQLAPHGIHDGTLRVLMFTSAAWMVIIGVGVILVGGMHQIPRSFLRRRPVASSSGWLRRLPRPVRPRLTWIPAGVSIGLMIYVLILGWFTPHRVVPSYNGVGKYVTFEPPLEGFRNALIWALVGGLALLFVLGIAIRAYGITIAIPIIGALWFLVIWGNDPSGATQESFTIGGAPAVWFIATVYLFAAPLILYSIVRETSDERRSPLWATLGITVLSVAGIGVIARNRSWWVILGVSLLVVLYVGVMFWSQVRGGHDRPEYGSMRHGTALVMASLGLISIFTAVSSSAVWVARMIGTAVSDPAPAGSNLSADDIIRYPAEAGWVAFAAFAGIVVFLLFGALRFGVLYFARWRGKETYLCAAYDEEAVPLFGYDVSGTCAGPPESDQGRLAFAKKARTSRLIANFTDDVDWIVASAIGVVLAILVATILSRTFDRLPSGYLSAIIGFATWAIGFVVVGSMWAVRTAKDSLPLRQAFGMLWEVMSFFPRRFHPLAPPCYAERAVIDVRDRLIWLGKEEAKTIVVAHSEGTMITFAALISLCPIVREVPGGPLITVEHPQPTGNELSNLAWVTYGCMLNRLFGRAWPDQLRAVDMRRLKVYLDEPELDLPEDPFPPALIGRLPRWMNFGRYTDYLGGRVFSPPQKRPTKDDPWPEGRGDARCDDVFFGDPVRRWRIKGQVGFARMWRHSYNYESDEEDQRFRQYVWNMARVFGGTLVESTVSASTASDHTCEAHLVKEDEPTLDSLI